MQRGRFSFLSYAPGGCDPPIGLEHRGQPYFQPEPQWKFDVQVTFDIAVGTAAMLMLVDADGRPLPLGSVVALEGQERQSRTYQMDLSNLPAKLIYSAPVTQT